MTSPGKYIKKKVRGLQDGRFYCEDCGHLLAKGRLESGWIEVKCSKCNKLSWFENFNLARHNA